MKKDDRIGYFRIGGHALAKGMFSSIDRRVASGSSSESSQRRYMGVMTSAGMTALTRTPVPRGREPILWSRHSCPWRRRNPEVPPCPVTATFDPTLITLPLDSTSLSKAKWVRAKTWKRFLRKLSRKSEGVSSIRPRRLSRHYGPEHPACPVWMVFNALRQASSSVNSVGMQKACPLSCLICSTRSLPRGVAVHNRNNRSFLCERTGDGCPDSLRSARYETTFPSRPSSCGSEDFLGGRAELVDAKLDQVPFLQVGFRFHAHAYARRSPRRNDAAGSKVMN